MSTEHENFLMSARDVRGEAREAFGYHLRRASRGFIDTGGAVVRCAPRQIHRVAGVASAGFVAPIADVRVLPSAACGDILSVLGDSTLSIERIAAKLGDSSDKGKRYVAETLAKLLELRLVRSYDGGGITWFELVNQAAAVEARAAEVFDLAAFRSRIDAVHTAGLVDLDTDALSPDARLLVRLAPNALDTARIHVEQAGRLPPPRRPSGC